MVKRYNKYSIYVVALANGSDGAKEIQLVLILGSIYLKCRMYSILYRNY